MSDRELRQTDLEEFTGDADVEVRAPEKKEAEPAVKAVAGDAAPARPTPEQAKHLEDLMAGLLKSVFGVSGADQPLITTTSRQSTRGYYLDNRWVNGDGVVVGEIALNLGLLSGEPKEALGIELTHNVGHWLEAREKGPRQRHYHDQDFAKLMDGIGLPCHSLADPEKEMGDKVEHRIEAGGKFERFIEKFLKSKGRLPWRAVEEAKTEPAAESAGALDMPESKSGRRVKFVCPQNPEGHNALARPDADYLGCTICNVEMIPAMKEEGNGI